MSRDHDPIADPLTPDWRAKVDAVIQHGIPRRAPAFAREPLRLDQLPPQDQRIAGMWALGAPAVAVAAALKMPVSSVWSRVYSMQGRGLALDRRSRAWTPPEGWQNRLADILVGPRHD